MRKWFLVRHGQTAYNLEGRAQGQSESPLNDTGAEQARAAAERLRDEEFAVCLTSDLRRVLDTAKPILAGRDIRAIKSECLREKDFGDMEGKTFAEVERESPELFRRLFADDPDFTPPGGESDRRLIERVSDEVDALIASGDVPDGANILVVAHGGTIRALITHLIGLPPETLWRFLISNGSLSTVTAHDDGRATLDLLNCVAHLASPQGARKPTFGPLA